MDGVHVSVACPQAIAHSCQVTCQIMPNPYILPALGHLPRVVGPYVQTAVDTAAELGVTPQQLALQLGLPEDGLAPPPEALPVQTYIALLNAGADLCHDPYFGLHVGERMKLATYAIYGIVLLSCRNFAEATQQVMRYEVLAHDLGRSQLRLEQGSAWYVWQSQWHESWPCRHLAESVCAGIRVFVEWVAQRPVPIIEIGFTHAAPDDLSEYQRIFNAPIRFNQPENYARFDPQILAWPLPNADVSLFPVLQAHAEQLLQARLRSEKEKSVVALVREAITQTLAQDRARLTEVAEQLGQTTRTLQRKLKDAGTSFQEVLDHTRRELAEHYLVQAELSITDIAYMLGFQEQSSFNHAFKDWTGLNPGAFRLQRLARGQA